MNQTMRHIIDNFLQEFKGRETLSLLKHHEFDYI